MKKTRNLFIVWTIIVVIIIVLLTTLGLMLKNQNKDYEKLEKKLLDSAKKYVDNQFLYPEGNEKLKVTSSELIQNQFLDELKFNDDVCQGYVIVSKDGVYQYKGYIKCKNYTTRGYQG